ncbi:quinone-dependent dihydroorotate dehydrogenase [Hoeflea prorocentri]|uniref:Dihydroorotate dehydrogenase (quinone) n=1 Tax=Hoeflea prorocentri TaxID=1922333 RepID=A0A9X3UJH1_9HYPH|nr:quinone-dependent dihydroorotate dehydrogenase [Hoeflea prorocentri]MCY6382503.1 quinone-dependent dihydroorotate dehydrogenase [Hoeflea prorocentri]MDA5400303.1 quinone-dependent dihydroorotate dehydrogenase [Hoeflea prorocentri]
MEALYPLLRHALFRLEPEAAHRLSIKALKSGLMPRPPLVRDPRLSVTKAGLHFNNPVGIAAGFDKNGEVPAAVLRLGFGFTEIGSVTPRPQTGNPKPRIFRLHSDRAVINRLGFNNEGHSAVLQRLMALGKGRAGPIGVNVGANKNSEDRISDYALGIDVFYQVADYFTVNISSPNTPGLRDLQARDSLTALLAAVKKARDDRHREADPYKPIFLKIAPDLNEGDLEDIAELSHSHTLDGLMVSNTTLAREGLSASRHAGESGGVSGRPLFERSTIVLAKLRRLVGPSMTLVGLGGVDSAETAAEKMRAGADLVQLYTGLIYEGPGIISSILSGLVDVMDRTGAASVNELRDLHLNEWAGKSLN